MVGGFGVILTLVLAGAAAPSRGDVWREIYTDADAFEAADLNRDGRISEYEYETYFAERRQSDRKIASGLRLPGSDANADGAFTPDELYAEAHRFDQGNGVNTDYHRDDYYGNPYSE